MKIHLSFSLAVFAGLLAAGEFRIDLVSMKDNVNLEIRDPSGKFKIIDSPWYKEKRKQSIEIRGETTEEWRSCSFTFVPDKDGKVRLRVRAPYVKPGTPPKVCAYDNIKVEGAELKNGSFEEKTLSSGWIPGWGTKDGLMTGDADDGNSYIRCTYAKSIGQDLVCKAGVPVKVSFMAKNAMW